MATDDSNNDGPKVKMFELRGEKAEEVMRLLGLDPRSSIGGMSNEKRSWTKNGMVRAFGNFLEDNIGHFASDMEEDGMSPKDIFEAIHTAVAHQLGAVERARQFLNDSNGTTVEGPADLVFNKELKNHSTGQVAIGWNHKDFHLKNTGGDCTNPYKLDESDEDSPAEA